MPSVTPTSPGRLTEVAHGAVRGVVGAMAMTGLRTFTTAAGLVAETPPRALARQKAKGLIGKVPRKRRPAAIELFHWSYGAGGGAMFAALPAQIRRFPGAGPIYGIAVWLGFELGLAPLLGLDQAKEPRPIDRLALAVDHALYGFVLSEMRARAQESGDPG
jgi:hypothetical protein